MGCVAFNTHVAFWTVDDSMTQVKMLGKNAWTFSIHIPSKAGVALTGSIVLSNLFNFPLRYSFSFVYACVILCILLIITK